MSSSQRRLLAEVLRRQSLYLRLSILGTLVGLAVWLWTFLAPQFGAVGPAGGAVIGLLILLNARAQLRQHRLSKLLGVVAKGQQTRADTTDR